VALALLSQILPSPSLAAVPGRWVAQLAAPGDPATDERYELRRAQLCEELEQALASTRARCPVGAPTTKSQEEQVRARRTMEAICRRSPRSARCRGAAEALKQEWIDATKAADVAADCARARGADAEARERLQSLAPRGPADASVEALCPPCAAEGPVTASRGRLAIEAAAGPTRWIDVEAEGAASDAVPICQQLLRIAADDAAGEGPGLALRVVRTCATSPLPAMASRGGHLLVDPRSPEDLALIVGLKHSCHARRAERVRLAFTVFTRFADPASCERARKDLVGRQRDARLDGEATAEKSRAEMARALNSRAQESCARDRDFANVEAESAQVARAVKRACVPGAPPGPCERARKRAINAAIREIDASAERRSCQHAGDLAENMRKRADEPRERPAVPAPSCRPEPR